MTPEAKATQQLNLSIEADPTNPDLFLDREAGVVLRAERQEMIAALRLAEGRLNMLLKATLDGSDHPCATEYVLSKVRQALGASHDG